MFVFSITIFSHSIKYLPVEMFIREHKLLAITIYIPWTAKAAFGLKEHIDVDKSHGNIKPTLSFKFGLRSHMANLNIWMRNTIF